MRGLAGRVFGRRRSLVGFAGGHPEELLRSALEKIVFFECRVEQLEAELQAARQVAERARGDAAEARRRGTELEAAAAQLKNELSSAAALNAELLERARLLEGERGRLLSGLVEQARVAAAPAGDGDDARDPSPDLGGFIAELRSEIERLESWKRAAQAAGVTVEESLPRARSLDELKVESARTVPELASRFESAGRVRLTGEDTRRLDLRLDTPAEKKLYQASTEDLEAADPARRRRAADCLAALGSRAAAPLVAASLGRERDPEVKRALLAALAKLGDAEAAELCARELSHADPSVRAAALEAAASLDRARAVPRLAGALADANALVRRRAVILLGFTRGEAADDALGAALSDRDGGVARAAAVALSGRPTAGAQRALARALDHRDPAVRRAAARAVSRWAGEAPDEDATASERRSASRRIAEKLGAVDGRALREVVAREAVVSPRVVVAPVAAVAVAGPAVVVAAASRAAGAARPAASAPVTAGTGPATVAQDPNGGRVHSAPASNLLEESIASELRASLRGRSPAELADLLRADSLEVDAALARLAARGEALSRGPRWYLA